MHIIYIPNLITPAIIATECSEKEKKQTKQAINWTTRIGYAIKPAKQSMMRLKDRRGVDCDSGANKDHDKCLCHIYVYIYIHICGMCYVIWQIWDLRWRCGWRRLWFFYAVFLCWARRAHWAIVKRFVIGQKCQETVSVWPRIVVVIELSLLLSIIIQLGRMPTQKEKTAKIKVKAGMECGLKWS